MTLIRLLGAGGAAFHLHTTSQQTLGIISQTKMGKNDKKGSGKGKGGGDSSEGGGKTKGAQSINVRHILVSLIALDASPLHVC